MRLFRAIKNFIFPGGAAPPLLEWTRHDKKTPTAIVLVHGFTGDAMSTWPNFGKLLASAPALAGWDISSLRYQTQFLPDFAGIWRANAPLEKIALMLKTACLNGELADYPNLAFVAHSMGGLVVQRALVDFPELALKTRYLFLFGTPSAGLVKARPMRWWKRQLRDMARGGAFIEDLRSRWAGQFGPPKAPPFRLLAVAGESDEFVPAESSLPPFAAAERFVIPGDHLQIVKAEKGSDPGIQLVVRGIMGDAAPSGPWNAARVAVELGEFHKTIEEFGDPNNWDGLDEMAKVDLSLALESVGRGTEALDLLTRNAEQSPDLMGTLAGRLKRRWLDKRQETDATKALGYYQTAYGKAVQSTDAVLREGQGFYHAINCAFMMLAFQKNRSDAENWARKAMDHCARAPDGMWKSATLGEANLVLGRDQAALAHYGDALARGPQPRQIGSMYRQARKIAELLERRETAKALDALFRPEESVVRSVI